jgi:hypothetical protein
MRTSEDVSQGQQQQQQEQEQQQQQQEHGALPLTCLCQGLSSSFMMPQNFCGTHCSAANG